VLDSDAPDCLVDTILKHVSTSTIATNMLDRAKEGNPVVAHDLLQELDNAPAELEAAADLELAADESDVEVPCDLLGKPSSEQRKRHAPPRVNSTDACEKTFRRRHTLLRMSISRADASESQIRKNVARQQRERFAMEDPLMTAEVCSLLKTWRSLRSLCPSPMPMLLLIILLAASCGPVVPDWFPLGSVIHCSLPPKCAVRLRRLLKPTCGICSS
jgi:hypothetical protein